MKIKRTPKFIQSFLSGTFLTCLIFSSALSAGQANVVTQHNNLKRTGWNANETVLTQDNVSSGNFGKIFSRQVDDQIYAQPLVISNLNVGGAKHNVVIVATVNNSIYAFDADNANVSAPYWHQNLTYTPATYRPIKNTDMTGACGGKYKDFSGNMGIVCTPVIDTLTNTIYVLARSVSKTGGIFVHYLHALDLTTGAEKHGSPVYVTATFSPGSTSGSVGGVITFNQQIHNPRTGLLLHNGVVYMCWASHCDWGNYNGWVMGYDAATLQQKYVYNASPMGSMAGIWMSGQAPAVDDEGFIYLTTGNGDAGSKSGNPNDTTNRGESLLKLSTASGKLKVADFFTPMNYKFLNDFDLDYGVDGVLLIPNTNLSLSGSKESYLYLINNKKMGGTTKNNSNVMQLLSVGSTNNSRRHLHGSPVYFKDSKNNEYVYAWAEGSLLKQYPFIRSKMLFDTLNQKVGNTVLPDGMPGAMLSVSSNGSQINTGIIWANHPIDGDANQSVVPGVLQAFDATDVSRELWNSNWSSKRDSIGKFAKFVCPTIANGKVYMATFSNSLNVYGLNPPAASSCSNTLPLNWRSADIGYTVLAGDACYNNGTYTIKTSSNDVWNTADAFHYVYQPLTGDSVEITARVVSIQNTNPWAKCGIMFRENLNPGSPNIFLALTAGARASFQKRISQSDTSVSFSVKSAVPVPYWIKIKSVGNKYVGYTSPDGSKWTALDSVTLALGPHQYVGLAYTSLNTKIIGSAAVDHVTVLMEKPDSVRIVDFNGYNINNKYSQLKWSTENELNIDHYEIERSSSTANFEIIGSVKGKGNSSSINEYFFNDTKPQNGTNFYRLKQVDVIGNFKYSSTIGVKFNLRLIDIFPNPAHDEIYIRNNNNFTNGNKLKIRITDITGKILYNQISETAGIELITVNLPPKISSGMYVLMVTNDKGEKQARKIFITR